METKTVISVRDSHTMENTNTPACAQQTAPTLPFTCVRWKDFKKDPSILCGLFQKIGSRKYSFDPNVVTVMDPKFHKEAQSRKFFVNTIEDIEDVRKKLKNRLLVFRVQCEYVEKFGDRNNTIARIWLVVLVNTADANISSLIDAKIQEAKEHLTCGEIFQLKLNFGVKAWYQSIFEGVFEGYVLTRRGSITITNQDPPHKCFTCGSIYCLLCFPLWLLSAPCYRLNRALNREYLLEEFRNLPVAFCMHFDGELVEIYKDRHTGACTYAPLTSPSVEFIWGRQHFDHYLLKKAVRL